MNELEKKIYAYACDGFRNAQIGKFLDIDPKDISRFLNRLDHEKKLKIDFARQIRKEKEIEDTMHAVNQVISLVFQNYSSIEIAIQLDQPEQEIQNKIKSIKNLSFYRNPKLYEEVKAKEAENRKDRLSFLKRLEAIDPEGVKIRKLGLKHTQKDFIVYLSLKKLLILLKNNHYQLNKLDMQMKTGLSDQYISQLLEGKLYPELVQEILGKNGLSLFKTITFPYIQNTHKNNLEVIKVKKNQSDDPHMLEKWNQEIKLWIKIMFHYELSVKQIQELLLAYSGIKLSEETITTSLKKQLHLATEIYEKAFDFLTYYDSIRTEKEKQESFKMAQEFLEARRYRMTTPYKERYEKLLKDVLDQNVLKLIKENKAVSDYTQQDWENMIFFRIKYALSFREMPILRDRLQQFIPKSLEKKNEILNQFNKENIYRYNLSNKKPVNQPLPEERESLKSLGGKR